MNTSTGPHQDEALGAAACPADELLAMFVQGDVSAADRAYVEEHLDRCQVCRDLLAQLAETYVPDPLAKTTSTPPLFGSIDRYELLDVVGKGGMGTVYEARDPVLGRHVAVKVIEHTGDEARLLREGRAMARVTHPNVVGVHDAGAAGGRVFIAMDLIRGTSLREYLEKNRTLPAAQRIALFVQAARGLAAAHAANVIHRDFKPENVVVAVPSTGEPTVRVTDFGLARPPSTDAREHQDHDHDEHAIPASNDQRWLAEVSTQGLHGTPAYICPERLDGRPVDARSDQFSFAVALYEALFGGHPFGVGTPSGPTTLAGVREAMNRPLVRPGSVANMPAYLWPALARALSIDPDKRWPSMSALADALDGPDDKTRRQIGMLVASLSVAAVAHIVFLIFVSIAIVVVAEEGPEAPDSAAAKADLIFGTIFFIWAPLGFPLAVLSAYGIHKHRPWAYWTTMMYGILCIPSFIGTPLTAFIAYTLSRPGIKRVLGRSTT